MVALKANEADRYLASLPEGVRLLLVYGSDSGAITERARRIERIALERGGGDQVLRVGSDEISADPGRVADEAYSMPLFGGEPVIALRVLDGRHNVFGAVQALLERPPDRAWLIVEAGDLAPTSPLRKAFEASKAAAAIPAYPLDGTGLISFIEAAAEDAGVTIEPAARELLAENLGGDRLAIRGELEKLFLYVADRKIVTFDDVEAIVGDTTGAKTDQVIDAALLGEGEALELGLGRMRAEGSYAGSLGTLMLRHLLQLQSLRVSVDKGEAPSRVIEFARIYSRRRSAVEAELVRWPSDRIMEARRRVDRAIALTRLHPSLEDATMSEALHGIAVLARRLKRNTTA